MDTQELKDFCAAVTTELDRLFDDLCSGMSAREDSRAFGAMIERRITDNWDELCGRLDAEPSIAPGRRTIYDFACTRRGRFYGFDVKTKDLDSTSYSDGGVCAVGNLLKFISNEMAAFIIVEFGHKRSSSDQSLRDLDYIRVAPFHMLPSETYRIENLGTGQVRLNFTVEEVFEKVEWDRTTDEFCDIFSSLSITHYERVKRDADKRADSMRLFKEAGFKDFKFR